MKKVLALAAAGVFAFSVSAYAGAGGCGGYTHTVTADGKQSAPVKQNLETATTSSTKSGS
jgi:hypothetical protein